MLAEPGHRALPAFVEDVWGRGWLVGVVGVVGGGGFLVGRWVDRGFGFGFGSLGVVGGARGVAEPGRGLVPAVGEGVRGLVSVDVGVPGGGGRHVNLVPAGQR
jgi:hypothetical protein